MNIIPICAITDEKYPNALATLFTSALENASKETFYKFYCFITGTVKQADRDKILELQNIYPDKCSVEIFDMGDKYLDENPNHRYITNACWYKFSIVEKVKEFDKVIYIDTDTVVFGDLTELYNTNLEDNYIAGVLSSERILFHPYYAEQAGIPDTKTYINAGVLLMNLKKIREDNLISLLEPEIRNNPLTVDQDIFNKICYGKIKLLEPKYNVLYSSLWTYESKQALAFHSEKEIEEALEHPVIFHYAMKEKPWEYYGMKYEKEWLNYYKKSPYRKINLKRKSYKFDKFINNVKKRIRSKIKNIVNKISSIINKHFFK